MKIIQLTAKNVVEEIHNILREQQECFVWGIPDKNYVFSGRNENYNKEYCIENSIGILSFPNEGGVLVINKGDVELGHFSKDVHNKFNENFATELTQYLQAKSINASMKGNDIIIDDVYKCVGYSSRRYGEILYSAFHISINVNLELIKNICTKPMVKIPKGLSDYGVTTEEVLNLLKTMELKKE